MALFRPTSSRKATMTILLLNFYAVSGEHASQDAIYITCMSVDPVSSSRLECSEMAFIEGPLRLLTRCCEIDNAISLTFIEEFKPIQREAWYVGGPIVPLMTYA